jgi:hypothetical protein
MPPAANAQSLPPTHNAQWSLVIARAGITHKRTETSCRHEAIMRVGVCFGLCHSSPRGRSSRSGRAGFSSLMPALCQPPYSQQPDRRPRARAKAKRANLACMRCVHSKLALFAKSPEVCGSKNTVCLPAPIQI